MEPVRLEDICPETGEFELAAFPGEIFHLRPISLSDSAWMIQKFGGQAGIELMFKSVDLDKLSILIFRLLQEKEMFASESMEEYDDDGNKVQIRITGPEKLKRSICGPKEQIAVIQALLKTIGVSQPLIEESPKADSKKKSPRAKRATRR